MFGTNRSAVGQVFIGAIVVLIIVVFALGGQLTGSGSSDACAVKVYDSCTRMKEFNAALGLTVRASGFELTSEGSREVKRAILEGLVERDLLLREAERLKIAVGEKEVDDELLAGRTYVSLPADRLSSISAELRLCKVEPGGCAFNTEGIRMLPVLSDGKFNHDRYKRVVRSYTGRGEKQFKKMQKDEMTARRMRALVRSRVRISEEEAFLLWERERSEAVIRSVEAKSSWFAKYVLNLPAAEVDEWAMANKEQVDAEFERIKGQYPLGCRLAREILVIVDPAATDEEKVRLRERIDQARKRAQASERFDLLARQLSDARSAEVGGQLGCLGPDYGPGAEDLLQALGSMATGDVSPVIESVRGFHVLLAGGTVSEAEVEAVARRHAAERLATRDESKSLAETFAKDLIGEARTSPSLKEATETLVERYLESSPIRSKAVGDGPGPALRDDARPKVQISSRFSKLGRPVPTALAPELASLAFALKVDETHGAPLPTTQGSLVIQLKEKEIATREAFDEDKVMRMRQLRHIKADEALAQYVARLRKAAEGHITMDKALTDSLNDTDASADPES